MDSTQLSLIIGGPNRPPSKRQLAQAQADEIARRSTARSATTSSSSAAAADAAQGEGYWAYLSRNVQERTERLGIMGDGVDRLEENSAGWASDVNKFVAKQKRGLMMGGTLLLFFSFLPSSASAFHPAHFFLSFFLLLSCFVFILRHAV